MVHSEIISATDFVINHILDITIFYSVYYFPVERMAINYFK